jgi:hypothetical protein
VSTLRIIGLAIALVAIASGEARAQQVVVERREVPVGAGMPVLGSGTIVAALSTGIALIVATTSPYDADRYLFIPLAGPWIDLANRPPNSPDETWARVGLVVDGLAQALGLGLIIVGTVMHHQPKKPRTLIVPIATSGGAGLSFTF